MRRAMIFSSPESFIKSVNWTHGFTQDRDPRVALHEPPFAFIMADTEILLVPVGQDAVDLDMSLFRTFKLTERVKMEFKAECFNITNTPKFSNPGSGVASMVLNSDGTVRTLNNFSSITSTLGGLANPSERQFRFGLRLSF